MSTCSDIIAKRGLVSALFKPLSADFFIKAGLGFGQARALSGQILTTPPEQMCIVLQHIDQYIAEQKCRLCGESMIFKDDQGLGVHSYNEQTETLADDRVGFADC